MTITLLPDVAWLFLLMFARLGTLIMLMPAIGERVIPPRIRIGFALAASFILYPLVSANLPVMPDGFAAIVVLVIQEMLIGFVIGLSIRLLLSALQVAGNIIAFQMGLGFAMNIDPSQGGQQSVLIGNFLGLLGTVMIFASNLHHLAIAGMVDSFKLFPSGGALPLGDSVAFAIDMAESAFRIAVQISAPFIVFGLVFYLGLGVLSRLMPQLQIFLIAMPLSIVAGFILLAVLLASLIGLYLDHLGEALGRFLLL
jgi:flagellar biosynthetic protein FliR